MKQILSLNKTNFYMVTTNGNVFLPYKTDKRFFIYTDIEDEVFVFGDIPTYAYDFLTKCMNAHLRYVKGKKNSPSGPLKDSSIA